MNEEVVNSLREVDRFYKNCLLLFDDLIASIKEKTLFDKVTRLIMEKGYSVWSAKSSEFRALIVIEHNSRFRFALLLVKVNEELLPKSPGFKSVCQELGINMLFPLIIVTGVFEPRDIENFRTIKYDNRRNWALNTLLLDVPDDIKLADPMTYRFGEKLTVTSQEGTSPWYCEKAIFYIRPLTEIKDSKVIEERVEEMLKL
jgi:hypothetical protein